MKPASEMSDVELGVEFFEKKPRVAAAMYHDTTHRLRQREADLMNTNRLLRDALVSALRYVGRSSVKPDTDDERALLRLAGLEHLDLAELGKSAAANQRIVNPHGTREEHVEMASGVLQMVLITDAQEGTHA